MVPIFNNQITTYFNQINYFIQLLVIEIGLPIAISDVIAIYQKIKDRDRTNKTKKAARYFHDFGYQMLDCRKLGSAKEAFDKALTLDSTNSETVKGLFKATIFEPIFANNPIYYDVELTLKRIDYI